MRLLALAAQVLAGALLVASKPTEAGVVALLIIAALGFHLVEVLQRLTITVRFKNDGDDGDEDELDGEPPPPPTVKTKAAPTMVVRLLS